MNNCYMFRHLNNQQKEIVANAMEEKKFKYNIDSILDAMIS